MKRLLLLAILLSSLMPRCVAQTLDIYFVNAPKSVLPLLDRTARLDLMDLYASGLPAKAENLYGGQSELLKKTSDYLMLKTSDAGTWQLKVLTAGHDTLLVCIQSVEADGVSSRISVYQNDWKMVKRDMPHLTNEKFVKNSTEVTDFDRQRLMPTLLHLPIQATWHADEPVITFCLSLNSLPKEYINLAKELTKNISYKWQSGKFVAQP